jgi:hypothetical protein
MSLAILNRAINGQIITGNDGQKCQVGFFQFAGAAASDTLPVKLRQITAMFFCPVGGAGDEEVSGPAPGAGGRIMVDGTGQITITRTGAAKTNNLVVSYLIFGA